MPQGSSGDVAGLGGGCLDKDKRVGGATMIVSVLLLSSVARKTSSSSRFLR